MSLEDNIKIEKQVIKNCFGKIENSSEFKCVLLDENDTNCTHTLNWHMNNARAHIKSKHYKKHQNLLENEVIKSSKLKNNLTHYFDYPF